MGNKQQKQKQSDGEKLTKLLLQDQNNTIKNQCYQIIKKGELEELKKHMLKHKLSPNEELSEKGHLWTSVHYACHFKQPYILEYLLKDVYRRHNKDYQLVMLMGSKDGWNPFMISAIYNSFHCIKVLIAAGGIDVLYTDKEGRTALDLAEKYNAVECIEQIKLLYQNKNKVTDTIIPINEQALHPENTSLRTLIQQSEEAYNNKLVQQQQIQIPDDNQSLLLNQKPNGIKNKSYQFIKGGDLESLKLHMAENLIKPNEEISVKGHFWTMLHYAVHFGKEEILFFLLQQVYKFYPYHYEKVLNLPTKDGWTAFMLSAIYKQPRCMKILIQTGGIDLSAKDNITQNIYKLNEKYKDAEVTRILKELQGKGVNYIPLNKEMLLEKNESNFSALFPQYVNKNSQQNDADTFVISGVRKPCVLCQTNEGYIMYTSCCHCPLHLICYDEVALSQCSECNQKSFQITAQITIPSKAFNLKI